MLAMGFAVLALAKPYVKTSVLVSSHVVFVLDTSASMRATDVHPSRFDAARALLLNDAKRLPAGTRFALVLAGPRPTIRLGFTTRREELRRALSTLQPTDASANLAAAVAFANALATDVDVRLYTDTPVEGFESATRLFREAHPKDIAVFGFTLTRDPSEVSRVTARATIANYTDMSQRVRLTLDVDGVPVDAQVVEIAAGATAPATFRFRAGGSKDALVTLSVASDDDLDANNRAYHVLSAVEPLRVLVVGERSPFLDALLGLNGDVLVRHVSPDAYIESDEADLTVFHRTAPKTLPRGDSLLIEPTDDVPFAKRLEVVPVGAVTWDARHPLTRFCDFGAFSLRRAWRFQTTPATQTLVSNGPFPLIALAESVHSRAVLLAFDAFQLEETDFPLRPVAVVFFANLIGWVQGGLRLAPESVLAGDIVRWGGRGVEPDGVTLPSGARVETGAVFRQTEEAGIYRVFSGERFLGAFAVNVAPDESPVFHNPVKPTNIRPQRLERKSQQEIWQVFALMALGFLLAEWWVFHRR